MNKYAETLRSLFNFTRLKFIILANETGYNLSYISKWNNGTKLPSKKNIHRINEIAASLFSEEVIKTNRVSSFFVEFNLLLPESSSGGYDKVLKDCIADLLNTSYAEAIGKTDSSSSDTTLMAIGNSEVRSMLHDVLTKENFNNQNNFYEILLSLTICNPITEYILSLLDKNRHMHLKIGINKEDLAKSLGPNLFHLYRLCSENPRVTIELYSNENFRSLNLIVAKNIFLMSFSTDGDNNVQILSNNKNHDNVQKAYKIFNKVLNYENLVLNAIDNASLDSSRYRAGFYSGDYFNFLSVYGFEFLLPPDVIVKIADLAYKKSSSQAASLSIRKLQIAWEENFQTKHICFFIFKSCLLKYLEDGKLVYSDTRYQMSIDERLRHIEYALEMMRNNPKIEFYIIDDSKIKKGFNNFTIGVYTNSSKMFLKNYLKIFEQREPCVSIASDTDFIKLTNEAFNELKKQPMCRKYTVDDLEDSWERYKNMFLRIMQINISEDEINF